MASDEFGIGMKAASKEIGGSQPSTMMNKATQTWLLAQPRVGSNAKCQHVSWIAVKPLRAG